MTLLIQLSDISAIESISANTDFNKKIRPHIIKAQDLDVRPLLGEQLWLDVLGNIGNYVNLLNEHTYTYKDKKYQHPGLKAVIVEYTLSRYKPAINIHDTPFGLVEKENPYSTRVSDKTIAREVSRFTSAAETYWLRVKRYLDHHKDTITKWEPCSAHVKLTGNGLRIRKASK